MFSSSFKSGFTLIEMMVVVAIFVIATGIVLANLPAFRNKSSLDLTAQEVATVIRQAQVYGAGTRQASTASKFPSYGIYFRDNGKFDHRSTVMELFQDQDGNSVYTSPNTTCPSGTECVEKYNFSGGLVLQSIEGYQGANSSTVFLNGGNWANDFHITFIRPGTDAKFYSSFNGGASTARSFDYVKIILETTTLPIQCRAINVWSTGHIYVDPAIPNPCP